MMTLVAFGTLATAEPIKMPEKDSWSDDDSRLVRAGITEDPETWLSFLQQIASPTENVPGLIQQIGDDSSSVREHATQILLNLPLCEDDLKTLQILSSSPDPEIRIRAAKILKGNTGREKIELLYVLCRDLQKRPPNSEVLEPLLACIPLAETDGKRELITSTLLHHTTPEDLPVYQAMQIHKSPAVRSAVLNVLQNQFPEQQSELLPVFLEDPDAHIRLEAARLLVNASYRPALHTLVELLYAEEPRIPAQSLRLLTAAVTGTDIGIVHAPLTSEEKAKWKIWGDTESQTAELHLPLLVKTLSLSRGLVLHLPFLHSLKDSSDKLNHSHARRFPGQVSYVADRMNIANHAIRLEGQQGFIQVMDADILDPVDAFSLALWTHIDRLEDPKDIGGFLLCKWNSSPTAGDYILRIQSDGKLALTVSNHDPIFKQDFLISPAAVPLNEWVHLAATFSKGKLVLYVNGKVVVEKISTTVLTLSNGEYPNDDIQIGGLWNNHYLFSGNIDDVRIYDRALSPQELDLLFFESREKDLIESTNSYGTLFEAE